MKLESILKTIKEGKNRRYGSIAMYIPIRKGIGAKFYSDANSRNKAYENQVVFYNLGLAPRVGRKIDLEKGSARFGFITQHAPSIQQLFEENKIDIKKHCDYSISALLRQKTKELGYDISDAHWGNIGKLRNRYVFIDLDDGASAPRKRVW